MPQANTPVLFPTLTLSQFHIQSLFLTTHSFESHHQTPPHRPNDHAPRLHHPPRRNRVVPKRPPHRHDRHSADFEWRKAHPRHRPRPSRRRQVDCAQELGSYVRFAPFTPSTPSGRLPASVMVLLSLPSRQFPTTHPYNCFMTLCYGHHHEFKVLME